MRDFSAPYSEHDRSLTAYSHGSIAQTVFNENTKSWFIAVIMALSIAINIYLVYRVSTKDRSVTQELRLTQYKFENFMGNQYPDLMSQLKVDQALITAFGPSQCKK